MVAVARQRKPPGLWQRQSGRKTDASAIHGRAGRSGCTPAEPYPPSRATIIIAFGANVTHVPGCYLCAREKVLPMYRNIQNRLLKARKAQRLSRRQSEILECVRTKVPALLWRFQLLPFQNLQPRRTQVTREKLPTTDWMLGRIQRLRGSSFKEHTDSASNDQAPENVKS